jgi:hypothetical protein
VQDFESFYIQFRGNLPLAEFVQEVEEWVRCDWDSRYTNQPPT